MELVQIIIKNIVVLSGVIFASIAIHRFLYFQGVVNFEFNRVDRIKKLFTISFYTHLASVVSFVIIATIK